MNIINTINYETMNLTKQNLFTVNIIKYKYNLLSKSQKSIVYFKKLFSIEFITLAIFCASVLYSISIPSFLGNCSIITV